MFVTAWHGQRVDLLDEIDDYTAGITDRREFDILEALAMRGVMQMNDPLALTGVQTELQGARFTRLVAGHGVAVRDLIATPPDNFFPPLPFGAIGLVGSQNAVITVTQDVRLGKIVEKRNEFAGERRSDCH